MSPGDARRSDLEMFTGSGQWGPAESDREGLTCATQQQATIVGIVTMRAYFDAAGRLAALSATMPDGQAMEFDPAQIANLAAQSGIAVEPRSRTLGRGKSSMRG